MSDRYERRPRGFIYPLLVDVRIFCQLDKPATPLNRICELTEAIVLACIKNSKNVDCLLRGDLNRNNIAQVSALSHKLVGPQFDRCVEIRSKPDELRAADSPQ